MKKNINKYDLMLNGNMGYNGAKKYIKEIKEICKNKSCTFYINEHMYDKNKTQFSKEIFNYIIKEYNKKEEYEEFSIYSN